MRWCSCRRCSGGWRETIRILRISVRTGVGALLIPALQAGEISLYAGGLRDPEERLAEGLEERFLYNQSNCIVVAKSSPLSSQSNVTVADLARHPWVLLSYDSIAAEQIGRLFRARRMPPPQYTVSTQSLNLALELVRRDGFLTSLPRPLVHPRINPELSSLKVRGYEWTIRSGVTFRSSMRSLAPVKTMLAMLKQDVARLGFE